MNCMLYDRLYGRFWSDMIHHHHQNTNWGNVGVHSSSTVPEACRMNTKAHWGCSVGSWWHNTFTKPSKCSHHLSTTIGIKSGSVFTKVRFYLQARSGATHLPLDSTHACTLGIHRLVGEPEACVHMLDVANRVAIFNVRYAHAVHLFPQAEIELLLWLQCRGHKYVQICLVLSI